MKASTVNTQPNELSGPYVGGLSILQYLCTVRGASHWLEAIQPVHAISNWGVAAKGWPNLDSFPCGPVNHLII